MNAALACLVALGLAATSCAVPTLAQRQEEWRSFRKVVTYRCELGMQADRAMPEDVMDWCVEVAK